MLADDINRILIRNYSSSVISQLIQQPMPSARLILQIGVVIEVLLLGIFKVFGHPFHNKMMKAIGCPGVIAVQPLIDEQRFIELVCPADGIFERVIILKAPIGLHPIQYIIPIRAGSFFISTKNTLTVDIFHK